MQERRRTRRLDLACPICGSRNAIEYRYTEDMTECSCIICHSNWTDKGRLGEKAIRAEYRRNVYDEDFIRKRNKPVKPRPAQDTNPDIKVMIDRLNRIGKSINQGD